MPRFRVTIEYDGARFHGWQVQPDARTVQSVVEQAVEKATTTRTRITGAGRTDAGVHALGQVAHFDSDSALPPETMLKALNHWLPRSVAVRDCHIVPASFHACFSPSTKTYRYRILRGNVRAPLREGRVWNISRALDVRAMHDCAQMLVGEHDFTSFCSEHAEVKTRVRRLLSSDLTEDGDELHYTVAGRGFLYNMVRIIVGTLIDVGLGGMTRDNFAAALLARRRTATGITAPACGLTLMRIDYDDAD
jgi:tRNA pseudouridine38-40 synthase